MSSLNRSIYADSESEKLISVAKQARYGLASTFKRLIEHPFDPQVLGLNKNIKLTKFCELRGAGSKIPRAALKKLFDGYDNMIGMDGSLISLERHSLMLVQSVGVSYPVIDDPYIMGKIACADVLSRLYAMGASDCDNMHMVASVSSKMSEKERDLLMALMMLGFKDAAREAGTQITGGHTAENPWCLLGGVATSICLPDDLYLKEEAVPNEVLVLTKPLGTEVAIKAYNSMNKQETWDKMSAFVTKKDIELTYKRAMLCMARLNRNAARLMRKHNARCATYVNEFGLLAHAQNLVEKQKNKVDFIIHNLPIIAKVAAIAKALGRATKLFGGLSPEISGGLLICFPRESAVSFCNEIAEDEGHQAWIIGAVETGTKGVKLVDNPAVIEFPSKEKNEFLNCD